MAHSMKSEAMALGARVATMGLGVAVAGHLGGAVVGWLGAGLLGAAGVAVVNEVSKKFGELAGEQAAKAAGEAMLAKFDKGQPGLEDAVREALRISLNEVLDEIKSGYKEWFAGWEYALKREVHPDLSAIGTSALLQQSPEDGFCRLLEVLFAQSEALRNDSQSVTGLKSLLDPLRAELLRVLPALLQKNFRDVKNSKDFDRAWKAADDIVQAQLLSLQTRSLEVGLETLEGVKAVKEQTALLPQIAVDAAVAREAAEAYSRHMIVTQAIVQQMSVIMQQVFATAPDWKPSIPSPPDVVWKKMPPADDDSKQFDLYDSTDKERAIAMKSKQVVEYREAYRKLPRSLFELGMLYEVWFDWQRALEAYKEAWELDRNPEYGFKYANAAQHQNRFEEAIRVYEHLSIQ